VVVKHITPTGKGEEGVEVARGDRLSDRKGVAAGWHRHLHPVEEHTWVDVVYHPVANGVIDAAEGLGRAVLELCTSRSCRRDLAHLNRRSRRCWSGRGCRRCCSCRRSSSCSCRCKCSCGCRCERSSCRCCRCKCSCGCRCECCRRSSGRRKCGRRRKRRCRRSCRRGRGNVAVNERGALECGAGDGIEDLGNILAAHIDGHQSGALACLGRNQDVATQVCEVKR